MTAVIETIRESPQYQRFLGAIDNPNTRIFYEGVMGMYTDFAKAKTAEDLLTGDNVTIEDKIIEWVTDLKKAGLQITTVKSRLEVLKLFYEMNRKPLSWKMIAKMVGKARPLKHVGWRREQIAKMLPVAKIREQSVIMLFKSTGCRRGALEWEDNNGETHFLQMKHVIPRDQWHIFEFVIYEGEPEEYHCYCDPEARAKLEEYWKFRERHGETITPESYVFIQEWNIRDPEALKNPKPATIRSIEDALDRVVIAAGLRQRQEVDKEEEDKRAACGKIRHEQKLLHGFRSYFETTLLDSGFPETWVDMLEGHKLKGLRDNYYRPRDDTVLVGMSTSDGKKRMPGYTEIMAELIISDEERSKYEVKKLRQDVSEIESLKKVVEKQGKVIQQMQEEDSERDREELTEIQEREEWDKFWRANKGLPEDELRDRFYEMMMQKKRR